MAAGATAPSLDAVGLADACTSCHGLDGRSAGAIPAIGGLDRQTIATALLDFRDHKRSDATIMGRIARGYSDAEIDALADYFSKVGKP
jgi:cytochrome c553